VDRIVRGRLPAVGVRTRADGRAVEVAARLANGAAEALELDPGPARRLTAVAVEGTRNAVEHAYTNLPVGDVEIEVALRGSEPGSDEPDEVLVSIRDFGNGCALSPTPGEPPGLGLSIISELTECLSISSRKRHGTDVDAIIRIPGVGKERVEHGAPSHGSRIDFTDPVFLAPVIPRAIAVHAAGAGGSIDAVRSAIAGGRGIAGSIQEEAIAREGATASLSIDRPDGADELEVRMGPMPADVAGPLSGRLRAALDPVQRVSVEVNGDPRGERRVLVELPLS